MDNSTMQMLDDKLDKLIGCKEFKSLMRMLPRFCDRIPEWCVDILYSRTYLFAINDGDGLTTQLQLLAEVIGEIVDEKTAEICRYKLEVPEDEETLSVVKMSRRDRMIEMISNSGMLEVGDFEIACIDISEWIDDTDSPEFRVAISRLREAMLGRIIIFRVPVLDQAVLDKIVESISYYMNVKTVCTPPFSISDYMTYAGRVAADYELELDEGALEAFEKLLVERRNKPDFWGFRTVEAMINEVMFETLKTNFGFNEEDYLPIEIGE